MAPLQVTLQLVLVGSNKGNILGVITEVSPFRVFRRVMRSIMMLFHPDGLLRKTGDVRMTGGWGGVVERTPAKASKGGSRERGTEQMRSVCAPMIYIYW